MRNVTRSQADHKVCHSARVGIFPLLTVADGEGKGSNAMVCDRGGKTTGGRSRIWKVWSPSVADRESIDRSEAMEKALRSRARH